MEETQKQFIASNAKRRRSSSPHTAAPTASSTSYCASISSPASSSEVYQSTEEDMAYCLILLAQGDGEPQRPHGGDDENCCRVLKFSSRKLFDVYECKTCNRSFPSFQALGGHRASHKKPKSAVPDHERKLCFTVPVIPPPSIGDRELENLNIDRIPANFSLQISTNKGNGGTDNKSKIHECSICGSEFNSGQALGGHMRRHRANNNNQVVITGNDNDTKVKRRNILALDLNLPAPEDDHHHGRESKFQFPSIQQGLVLSTPALVDCYY